MAIHPHQFVQPLQIGSVKQFGKFRVAVDGTITSLWFISDNPATGTISFDVKKNAVSIYPGSGWPQLTVGQTEVAQTGLDIDVEEGDIITVHARAVAPFATAGQSMYMQVNIDDGAEVAGPGYAATSADDGLTIDAGPITINTQPNLAYNTASRVLVVNSAFSGSYFSGPVTAYNPTTGVMDINVTDFSNAGGGDGPWAISLYGIKGDTGDTGATGPEGDQGPAGISAFARQDVVHITESLTDSQETEQSIALGNNADTYKVAADRACRLRMYMTDAHRDADAARAIGVAPANGSGLLVEYIFTALSLTIYNYAKVFNAEGSPNSHIPSLVENLSGGTSTVQLTFTACILES